MTSRSLRVGYLPVNSRSRVSDCAWGHSAAGLIKLQCDFSDLKG